MNIDDPKLTAFALDELDEPERSTIARAIAASPEAQRFVNEVRKLATELRFEYADELAAASAPIISHHRKSLIDIRDDPWFWAKARPLALAASIALCAIVAAVAFSKYRTSRDSARNERWPIEVESDLPLPNTISNPVPLESIRKIDHIVVAELVDPQPAGKVHPIEVIKDAYRISKMQERLSAPTLWRNYDRGLSSRIYQLVFFDRDGAKVATAHFYRTGSGRFVLQLVPSAEAPVDSHLSSYALPFNDWFDSIGYAPGA